MNTYFKDSSYNVSEKKVDVEKVTKKTRGKKNVAKKKVSPPQKKRSQHQKEKKHHKKCPS